MPRSLAALSCESWRSLSIRFTSTASWTLSLRSFASGKPRSANTLPLPTSTLILFFAISHLVVFLRCPQPLTNERHVFAGCADARGCLLLERMQDINRLCEL